MKSTVMGGMGLASGAALTLALALVAACAASGDESHPAAQPSSDAGEVLPSDSGSADDAAPNDDAEAATSECSPDGWCPTTLPGSDIEVWDVVPFENRAFGLMRSANLNNKVAEWTPENGWQLISRNTGIAFPAMQVPGLLWAPDEDTVYFSVADLSGFDGGTYGAFIIRGRRPVTPATEWSWTTSKIDCDRLTSTAPIGGTPSGDVYTSTCGKVYRLDPSSDPAADAGTDALHWIEEDTGADQSSPLDLYAIGGTGPDDLWVTGFRWTDEYSGAACGVVLHKTAAGYRTLFDGVASVDPVTDKKFCIAKDGLAMLPSRLSDTLLLPAKNRLITATVEDGSFVKNVLVNITDVDEQVTLHTWRPTDDFTDLKAPWGTSPDDLFVIVTRDPFRPLIRAQSVWGSTPSYGFSQIAQNGLPNMNELYKVRGTSNQNVWLVGNQYAYHKTSL